MVSLLFDRSKSFIPVLGRGSGPKIKANVVLSFFISLGNNFRAGDIHPESVRSKGTPPAEQLPSPQDADDVPNIGTMKQEIRPPSLGGRQPGLLLQATQMLSDLPDFR